MHTYTPPNCILDGPITNLLSILSILIEILSGAHAKGAKSLNGFEFDSFIGRFQTDGAERMAVKGLKDDDAEERRIVSGSEFQTTGTWY